MIEHAGDVLVIDAWPTRPPAGSASAALRARSERQGPGPGGGATGATGRKTVPGNSSFIASKPVLARRHDGSTLKPLSRERDANG
ncbi:MAG: hypothetical protein KBH78_08445 [Candidatus Hydrogenedentes bacterium]|nr:hypothetical protein [Candidatus Hydrogenedentota bacterium]